MLVTEGKKSRSDRWVYILGAPALLIGTGLACALFPPLLVPLLWASFALAAVMVLRDLVLSLVARFLKYPPDETPARWPSIVMLVPSLNELPSFQETIPAHEQLPYEGECRFCYVCEGVSTDGSIEYVRERAHGNPRVVLIEKTTPPGGRGAAVSYGIHNAPRSEIVGFLDADHILDPASLRHVARIFSRPSPPDGAQGACESLNEDANLLTRALCIERRWLESVELGAAPHLGGMPQFGGGQGFFRRETFDRDDLAVDGSMILDDIDLSVRLAMNGKKVVFDPRIATRSLQPETLSEYLDQRFRWSRGWLQLARQYMPAAFAVRRIPLMLRVDLFVLTVAPFIAAFLFIGFAAAAAGLLRAHASPVPLWTAAACLAWPLTLGFMPYLSGAPKRGVRDLPLTLVAVPLLFVSYTSLCAASMIDTYVLRRKPRYSKTEKRIRPHEPTPEAGP